MSPFPTKTGRFRRQFTARRPAFLDFNPMPDPAILILNNKRSILAACKIDDSVNASILKGFCICTSSVAWTKKVVMRIAEGCAPLTTGTGLNGSFHHFGVGGATKYCVLALE
jgi:hypothetical protein